MRTSRAQRGLVAAVAALLLADVGVLARGVSGDGIAATGRVPATTTTTAAPPPPRIVFGKAAPADVATPAVFSVLLDGTGLEPSTLPRVPTRQVSKAEGLIVYSKTIHSDSRPYSGCGIAGCSSGYIGSTEAGIAVAKLDGTEERLLTSGGYDTEPSFSPDGGLIAFLAHKSVNGRETFDAVAIMRTDGSIVAVLDPPEKQTYGAPVWSPDGTTIVVTQRSTNVPAETPGASAIYLLQLDESPPRKITDGWYRDLSWSHNGWFLAGVRTRYVQYRGRTTWEPGDHDAADDIWIIPLDGSAPRNLTKFPTGTDSVIYCTLLSAAYPRPKTPLWSADDSQLAFLDNTAHLNEFGNTFDVSVINFDGSGRTTIYKAPLDACVRVDAINARVDTVEFVTLYGWA